MKTRTLRHSLVLIVLAACHVQRPSELPRDETWLVTVKSCRLPTWMDWYTRFAHHTWIDVKAGDETAWRRIEVPGQTTGVRVSSIGAKQAHANDRWNGREVRVLATIRGARARRIAEQIDAAAMKYDELFEHDYHAWPGPNSNTLIRWLADDIPELAFAFDHNALGKDHGLRVGLTPSKTGVSADASVIGFAFAAREGFELHCLGLTCGVQFWPPRLELPLLPEIPWPAAPVATKSLDGGDFGSSLESWTDADIVCLFPIKEGARLTSTFPTALKQPRTRILIGSMAPESWIGFDLELVPQSAESPQGAIRARVESSAPGFKLASVSWQGLFALDEHGTFCTQDFGVHGGRVRAHLELRRDEHGAMRCEIHYELGE